MLGLGLGKSGGIAQFAGQIESWFMRRFDSISTISYSMLRKAEQKTGQAEKCFIFQTGWIPIFLRQMLFLLCFASVGASLNLLA